MFAAQAHSFTQQARLAITLAWIAGYTNVVTLLACQTVTSHVSGTASNVGRNLVENHWGAAGSGMFLLGTFLCGAMVSGFATELGRRRGWESIYVLPIVIETLLLAAFAAGLGAWDLEEFSGGWRLLGMVGVASTAMGLQNATITRISSGVVRTTHVTGVLTDLGLETVQFLWWLLDHHHNIPPYSLRALIRGARAHPTVQRLALLASIIGSFAIGAGLGAYFFDHTLRWSMLPPVVFLGWLIYQDVSRPIAEIESSDLVTPEVVSGIAVYHVRRGRSRRDKAHRMPDLHAWADRLPRTTRVVILDLSEASELDANAAGELRAVLDHFAKQRRRLVLSGIDAEQFTRLRRMGLGNFLEPENVCPDLELAVARGMVLLDEARDLLEVMRR